MLVENNRLNDRQAFGLRLFVGASFGLMIALLGENIFGRRADETTYVWREIAAMTLAMTAFPIWAGAGSMRRWSLAVWAVVAFILVGSIHWFATEASGGKSVELGWEIPFLLPLLFIAHELVSSGDQAAKWIAPYETYFEEAWKRGVQLALAILFTLLFWGILWLGAALLGFIGFKWLGDLLRNSYFSWPMSGLAFATAVHLGDVQTKLLSNVRNLILGVLSWLLPVITLIGAIFAASLLVSGLAPLWATKAATATLLGGCVGFTLLINAAYQEGDAARPVPAVLKWCVRAASLLLVIFAVLAVWSLGLRIGQYGLTPERILAGLGVVVATLYGIGYSVAIFLPGRWMAGLERVNIGLAMVVCGFFIAILTPLAAPDRLSVGDQVARLNSGKVSVDKFDWWFLKDDAGTYGRKALQRLAQSPNANIAAKAKDALADKIGDRPYRDTASTDQSIPTLSPVQIAAIPVIFPADGQLPDSFTKANFGINETAGSTPGCLRVAPENGGLPACKAALLDLNSDGQTEVLLREGPALYVYTWLNAKWVANAGYIDIGSHEADFDGGKLRLAKPIWDNLMIGDKRIQSIEFPITQAPAKEPASTPVEKVAPPSK